MSDPSCNALEAVRRAQCMVGNGGQYILGTGDYNDWRHTKNGSDLPWTPHEGFSDPGSDCAGFAVCYCWKLRRHRPGYNVGPWASVSDDINGASVTEDAEHNKELAYLVVSDPAADEFPAPGDLITYPTIVIQGKQFIGHIAIIEDVMPGYVPGRYDRLKIIQCHGPNGFKPGVVRTDASLFMHHDSLWPKPEHRCKIVRMRNRT